MIWLVSLGVSKNHGSELLVGWQWIKRLRDAELEFKVLTLDNFRDNDFLDPIDRVDCIFLDIGLIDRNRINSNHFFITYRFWFSCYKYLSSHSSPSDHILIVSPASLWFMPLCPMLTVPRSRIFYGPIGLPFITVKTNITQAKLRNGLGLFLLCLWKTLWPILPRHMCLRFRSRLFEKTIGSNYLLVPEFPEIYPLATPLQHAASVHQQTLPLQSIIIFYDKRWRKNFLQTLEYSCQLASVLGIGLVIIGDCVPRSLISRWTAHGLPIETRLPMPRSNFLRWLRSNRFLLVSLSLSEGLSSLLVDALVSGCTLRILASGGNQFLIDFSSTRKKVGVLHGETIFEISWNISDSSLLEQHVNSAADNLLQTIKFS